MIRDGIRSRLAEALELALDAGAGSAIASIVKEVDAEPPTRTRNAPRPRERGRETDILLSSGYACTRCDIGFQPPNPQMFSFNSPQGMCPDCDGLGTRFDFDPQLLIPDPARNFLAPCIVPMRRPPGRWRRHLYEGVARYVGFDLKTPWRDLPQKAQHALLYGTGDAHITFEWRSRRGPWKHGGTFEGVVAELHAAHRKTKSAMVRRYYEQFMRQRQCQRCDGARLNPQALAITLTAETRESTESRNIDAVCRLPINRALDFFDRLQFDELRRVIAAEPLKEIRARLRFLTDVGLDYLTLDRSAPTLSGGESQRIRLASQIGCGLVGVLYVLDEPSIGLHPRDNRRLLASLKRLRDMGNTVIVVEHDRDTMEAADAIVDFGPGPGVRGGQVVIQGDLRAVAANVESVTGAYLSGREAIETPPARRPITRKKLIKTRKKSHSKPARKRDS